MGSSGINARTYRILLIHSPYSPSMMGLILAVASIEEVHAESACAHTSLETVVDSELSEDYKPVPGRSRSRSVFKPSHVDVPPPSEGAAVAETHGFKLPLNQPSYTYRPPCFVSQLPVIPEVVSAFVCR